MRVRWPNGTIVEMTAEQLGRLGRSGCQDLAVDVSEDGSGMWVRATNMVRDPDAVAPPKPRKK